MINPFISDDLCDSITMASIINSYFILLSLSSFLRYTYITIHFGNILKKANFEFLSVLHLAFGKTFSYYLIFGQHIFAERTSPVAYIM